VKEEIKISESHVQRLLNSKYIGNCKYKVPNIYVFRHDWESDFFVQKNNGYCYEFEIKISRSDFFADSKKKRKHDILRTGIYESNGQREHRCRPNKLFYVVPIDLVKVEEIPSYAGLMYVDGYHLLTIKEAPFIHKDKLKLEDRLCHKFYHYWVSEIIKNRDAKLTIESLERKIDRLKSLTKIE